MNSTNPFVPQTQLIEQKNKNRARVKVAVLLYEPRIEPLALRVASPDAESGVLRIELEYRVRAPNSRYNLVLPFYDDRDSNESVRSAARALSWTTSKP